jgi:Mrp family chromosome partitioning ATPase
MIYEREKNMSIQAKLPVVSFFSLTNIVEKTIIITNTAKSYCRQGYRTLLIDLDFTVPLIYTTLQTSKMLKFDCITTNDWLLDSGF